MRIARTTAAALAAAALAVSAAACGQGHAASAPSSPASATIPAASAAACTAALEQAGMDAVIQGAAHGGKYPAAVNRACDGLPSGEMTVAVNEAMSEMLNGRSATP
jgi:hypothetical protein